MTESSYDNKEDFWFFELKRGEQEMGSDPGGHKRRFQDWYVVSMISAAPLDRMR